MDLRLVCDFVTVWSLLGTLLVTVGVELDVVELLFELLLVEQVLVSGNGKLYLAVVVRLLGVFTLPDAHIHLLLLE